MPRMPTTVTKMPSSPICTPVCRTKFHGVTRRSSTLLDAMTSKDMRTSHHGAPDDSPRNSSGSLFCQGLAEQPLRPEHENQYQHCEGDEIAQLIGSGNADAVKKQRRADRLDHAEEKSADHRPWNIADAPQDSCTECLDARKEA